jgi:hypothetical protein
MEMPRSQDYCGTAQTIFGRLGRRSTLLEFNRHGTGVIRWSSRKRTCALLTLVSSRILNHQEGYPSPRIRIFASWKSQGHIWSIFFCGRFKNHHSAYTSFSLTLEDQAS